MSERERDERLGLLAEELVDALAAGEVIDPAHWATRFEVDASDVTACVRALRAFDSCLGEEPADGRPELPLPTLPESFRIEGELGRGGMGVVYRATQPALGRTVAVKVLRPGELQFGEALRRFRDEARSLARLRHRHIVSIHEVGETPEGLLWYSMDLVEGRTLADEIDAAGALTPSRAVRVMGQVTSAIAHAHAQGIVHRDLKPQNVLIDAAGDAYVVDFGLARDASTAGTRTLTGELLGTPAYMSPEQAAGEHARIGEPTDVWALGALLYESLTGRGPFAGKPLHGTIRAILEEEPKSPRKLDPRVPAELEAVAMKALRKKPEQRYPTALAFGEELERFADGRGVRARNPNPLERAGRFTWRHRSTVGIATLVALVFGLLSGLFVVPEQLRRSRIADARRAFEAGYAGAAVEPLRDVADGLADDDPAWCDFDLLWLQALNGRVAELLDAGKAEAAKPLFLEGRDLAARRWRAGRPTDPLYVDQAERPAWEFELLVCRALADHEAWTGEGVLPDGLFEVGVLGRRFHVGQFEVAWRHPGRGRRLCAEAVALELAFDSVLGSIDSVLHAEVLVSMHRRLARWIEVREGGSQPRPTVLSFGWTSEQVQAWWSPAAEDALAALAADPAEPELLRGLAVCSLSVWVGLPTLPDLLVRERDTAEFLARRGAAAPGIVSRWRQWRALSPDDALRTRIDALLEDAAHESFGLPANETWSIRRTLARWLGNDSLGRASDLEAARTWWAVRRERPVEEWIREDLGIAAEQEISCADALSAAEGASMDRALLWRHLASLRLRVGLRVPEIVGGSNDSAQTSAWLPAWRAAAGIDMPRQFVARLAVLMFREAGAPPELLGEAEQEIASGESVQLHWRAPIPKSFGPRVWWRSFGDDARDALQARAFPDRVIPPRWVAAELQCELSTGGERPSLSCTLHRVFARVPMDGGTRAGHSSGSRVEVGEARAFDWETFFGGSLPGTTEFALLVRLDPAGAPSASGDLEAWRLGCMQALRNQAANARGLVSSTDLMLPARWGMPEAADAVATLKAGLAGDATRLQMQSHGDAPDPQLDPGRSVDLADYLAPWFGGKFLAGIALLLGAAVGLVLAFAKPGLSGGAAWLAWLCAATLTFFRFEIDWFTGPPLYVFLLVAAVAGSRVPTPRSRRAPRVLAIGIPLQLAVWSFTAVQGWVAPPAEGAFWWMLLPPYVAIASLLRPGRR